MEIKYNKNFKKWFATPVIKAIKKYELIKAKEKIAVAVSGGKDSVSLAYILTWLKKYSYLDFELFLIHVKMPGEESNKIFVEFSKQLNIPYFEDSIRGEFPENEKSICSLCSRLKRGVMAKICSENSIYKIAYGHHGTDVAETFLMNLLENKKLGSFSPRVGIPDSKLKIIRPMIYLSEKTVSSIHKYFNLPIMSCKCDYEVKNIRTKYKEKLLELENVFGYNDISGRIVDSLENLDETNLWENLLK